MNCAFSFWTVDVNCLDESSKLDWAPKMLTLIMERTMVANTYGIVIFPMMSQYDLQQSVSLAA